MPFISDQQKREIYQTSPEYIDRPDADFSEVFAASVGVVIDEELSVSRMLNREGFDDRKLTVKQLIDSGKIDPEPFTSPRGVFDYEKAATTLNLPEVKTNLQLNEERNSLLAQRRAYAEDVISRGSGTAQFLGGATGYMLDPINIATMGISTAATGVKALSTIGNALITAKNTALLTAATELAIQPLVYQHKASIDSPYSEVDAISAIAMAAAGGAVIGGVVGSISGYLAKVNAAAAKLPQTEDIMAAVQANNSIAQSLKNAPTKTIEGEAEYLRELQRKKDANSGPSVKKEDYDEPQLKVVETDGRFRAGEQGRQATKTPEQAAEEAAQVEAKVVKAKEFSDSIISAKAANPKGAGLTPYTPEEYAEMDVHLFDDGKAGYAIDEGDLISVFKHPDSTMKGALDELVPDAIRNGAKRLDAFEGFLTDSYKKHGFVEVSRTKWDNAFKPEGWKPEDGKPDILVMELSEDAKQKYATDAGEPTLSDTSGIQRGDGVLAEPVRESAADGRSETGDIGGLPQDIAGFEPRHNPEIAKVAKAYVEARGETYEPPADYVPVNKPRAEAIAKLYDEMEHAPHDPEVKAAYKALIDETTDQYQAIVDSGLKVEFMDFDKMGDPYPNPRMATEDVNNNNHLWVYKTRDGFGSNDKFDPIDNPLLAETKFKISGEVALANDLFRVVHDYFGHVKEGVGFRAGGEENAWRIHSSMFSPEAQRALTTETRGQNSWLNFGPYGEKNRVSLTEDTHFADQKIGLLPKWVSEEGSGVTPLKAKAKPEQYHPAITGMARELTIGGDIALVSDEFGAVIGRTGRTASTNPEWFQNLAVEKVDGQGVRSKKVSVKEVKRAVEAFEAGNPTKSQAKILEAMSDVVTEEEKLANAQFAKQQEGEAVERGETFSSGRQDELLIEQGLLDEYEKAMLDYSRLENPIIPDGDELIDADIVMKQLDEELDGLNSIVVCASE